MFEEGLSLGAVHTLEVFRHYQEGTWFKRVASRCGKTLTMDDSMTCSGSLLHHPPIHLPTKTSTIFIHLPPVVARCCFVSDLFRGTRRVAAAKVFAAREPSRCTRPLFFFFLSRREPSWDLIRSGVLRSIRDVVRRNVDKRTAGKRESICAVSPGNPVAGTSGDSVDSV